MTPRALACALALLLPAVAHPASGTHPARLEARLTERELLALEAHALALANRDRAAHGLAPLAADPLATVAARRHSEEMRDKRYFSHESPEPAYRTWVLRLARAGVTEATSGENIGTYGSNHRGATFEGFVAQLEDNLMHSPKHRANLLNPAFNAAGIGLAIGESAAAGSPAVPLPSMWITQDFVGRRVRLDAPAARLTPRGLAVTLRGSLVARGTLRLFLHPEGGEESSEPVVVTRGRFAHTVTLRPGGARVRLDLGIGDAAGGRFEIANHLLVDPSEPPATAVGPCLEDE